MMKIYWPGLLAAFAFMVWTDTHTDETPVILGFLLILCFILGAAFPRRFLVTWLVLGTAVPLAETLVGFSILHAPWTAGKGFPWPALIAYIPALAGAGLGAGVRHFGAVASKPL